MSATLEAPSEATAGETIRVDWTGPDYDRDYIGVSRIDDPDGYENYAYTRNGTPAQVTMPTEPGEYELRYFVRQDRSIIARHPITVTDVSATLEAPSEATAGETIRVDWTGPDYDRDYIGVSRIDDPDGYENYAYTRNGTPAQVTMPTEPGEYELRYFVRQDRSIIARHPITVTDVSATLEAPSEAEPATPSASTGPARITTATISASAGSTTPTATRTTPIPTTAPRRRSPCRPSRASTSCAISCGRIAASSPATRSR